MNNFNNPFDQIKNFFREKSFLPKLILINVVVWLVVQAIFVIFSLYKIPEEETGALLVKNLAVPAYLPSLISRPWTIFTYMFLHLDFFHILFNMLWLIWFGKIFLQYLSEGKLLLTYILGGISGAVLYILFYNIFPLFEETLSTSLALGASASVMAIVIGVSFYVPNHTINLLFLGRIRIFYLALILFILDFFAISGTNSGGHIAHIGGALWGMIYSTTLRKWPSPGGNLFDSIKNFSFFGKRKMKATYSRKGNSRPVSDEEYNAEKVDNQKRIDRILEKISKGGYDSLTKDEKDFLFRSSGKKN